MAGNPRRKLIETTLPLEAINRSSAREKSIRHGHPSTLHLWWARRPLAACRAVLIATLVDDPADDPTFAAEPGQAKRKRDELVALIEELVRWENTNDPDVLARAQAEIARCVASGQLAAGTLSADTAVTPGVTVANVLAMTAEPGTVRTFLAEHAPTVLDPFCGGGSIPLEAQRLGLPAAGGDLNPVAVLVTKALVEIVPQCTPPHSLSSLASDVRRWGDWMRQQAARRIGRRYPRVKITRHTARNRADLEPLLGDELPVVAWLWARTVASPDPQRETPVPLVKSFWLCKKRGRAAWVEAVVDEAEHSYHFEVKSGQPDARHRKRIDAGTKLARGCKFRCLLSGRPIPEEYVKAEGRAGRIDTRLMAMVAESPGGRVFLSPDDEHQQIARATPRPRNIGETEQPLARDPRNLWCARYGLDRFDKLFTARQLAALATFSDLIGKLRDEVLCKGGSPAYADAMATLLALAVDRSANYWSSLTPWGGEFIVQTFGRQALPMIWDFAEANPFSSSTGSWTGAVDWVARCVEQAPVDAVPGRVMQGDAAESIGAVRAPVVCTDPPYYDNISYADLSDFFYVWLRRSLGGVYPELLNAPTVPKHAELVANPYRAEGGKQPAGRFFEDGLAQALCRIRETASGEYPLTLFYAVKGTQKLAGTDGVSPGWESMLTALVRSGFRLTTTWPLRTERDQGLKTGTNVLGSSILLVARPRPANAPTASRSDFTRLLEEELPPKLIPLQRASLFPADLAQAAMGIGSEIFSRFARVSETDGTAMTARSALLLVGRAFDEFLQQPVESMDPATRWAVDWFGRNGHRFGRREPGEPAPGEWSSPGIVEARDGQLRLCRGGELPEQGGAHQPVWAVALRLAAASGDDLRTQAATILRGLDGPSSMVRDLAYRLHGISQRRSSAADALSYHRLVAAWHEIEQLADEATAEK